ncbi:uncharacterized protein LOC134206864 [Armigeres subalbatus]|uniref:uncharacterized protein LOC134206864 n=1 Tax=Armigeres subalbatus TaxID=124917 RepID=UPI002ED35119
MKTLGVSWNPKEDCFTFVVAECSGKNDQLTKRSILSQIARIFDPLGFVGPAITTAKLIMRELWSMNLEWDQPVPRDLAKLWTDYRNQLYTLNNIKIERWIYVDGACAYELCGFADASDTAYGACLYARTIRSDGTANMTIVCSKSRILPKKKNKQKEITTPKAELLAAQLLSQLTIKVLTAIDTKFHSVTLWSDSQIVLCWLQKNPDTLTVFVGNRVRFIQQLTAGYTWGYIPSIENPADLISRGVYPSELEERQLWWHGPPRFHIAQPVNEQPPHFPEDELPEIRRATFVSAPQSERLLIFDRISRYSIVQRAMAYVIRFCDHVKSGRKHLTKGLPTASEMQRASTLITRLVQFEVFHKEIQILKGMKEHRLEFQNLNPFIDAKDGVLRVGGRLRHATIPYEHRHQALLPEKHPITAALIRYFHRTNMHLGQRSLLGVVRQQYWPLKAKNVIRKVLHHCIPCFRMRPKKATQLMGDLPDYRVQPSPVFSHTGLDFAGPFNIRSNAISRHPTITKGYVCLFVCMSTRAIHLEAVSNLSSESFMAALQRFISRRGLVQKLYSDNATNFEGANNQMCRLVELFNDEQHMRNISEYCAPRGIEWSFIPPRSPHFGGIWEAGVKSVKSHLKLVLAEHRLTFEALSTVLAQVEAILNSRPLTPASNDPNDMNAITPAHFLIGREFQAIPEPSYSSIPQGRLSRLQFIQDMKQKFWKIWMNDYLHELQKRQRDLKITKFKIGAMVVIIDEQLPPLKWALARITELHPGQDGHTRVVSLRTKNGTTKRAVKKVCLLPLDDEKDNAFG